MSEAVSALGNVASVEGIAVVREVGPQGMITLRGDLSSAAVKKAVKSASGPIPAVRQVAGGCAWMSPDELLILCDYGQVDSTLSAMQKALGSAHALAVDVSDARAMFEVSGPNARDVLAKLTPVDLSPEAFTPGMVRRTRLAQVAAAFWMRDADTFEVICFRSVAQYVFDLLNVAAQPGSEVGHYNS